MAHDVFAPDLVRRYTCIGHLCTEPLSVSRPVHLDTRARWIRVATRGVHVLRDVRIPTRVYTSRVPGTRQLHATIVKYRLRVRSEYKYLLHYDVDGKVILHGTGGRIVMAQTVLRRYMYTAQISA